MKKENTLTYILLGAIAVLMVALIALIPVLVNTFSNEEKSDPTPFIDQSTPEPLPIATSTPYIPTATICATGDLLMHETVMDAFKGTDGYNFDGMFKHINEYVSSADYAVANLETTLCGEDNGYSYSGYPSFNCPDAIVDGAKNAGFDMLLTANNHSYDTGHTGLMRTLDVVDEKGLEHLGVVKSEDEKNYLVKDINGIKVGMICYTYETDNSESVALNGIPLKSQSKGLINTFSYGELSDFYDKIDGQVKAMKNDGAEALVLFIHWGEEYQLKQNGNQEKIAQKMCDLGFDVIVGGHPHVVQPVEVLTSTDEKNKTVCLYSMGNAVSNQRRERMSLKTGHTEDGVLFFFTFEKADGTVRLSEVKIIPLWVNMYQKTDGNNYYEIIPLSDMESTTVSSDFAFDVQNELKESYLRTDNIVDEGMKEVENYINKE